VWWQYAQLVAGGGVCVQGVGVGWWCGVGGVVWHIGSVVCS